MQIGSKHLMNCFHVSGSRVAVLSSHRIQFSSSSRPEWILTEFTWNHFASYSQPPQAFFNIRYLRGISGISLFEFSLLIPDELMCSWCNRWQEGEGDCIVMASLWCKYHLFFPLPLHPTSSTLSVPPALSLHHFLFLTPPSLTFTLSSLQEVLELAFSVLYESDEYLNFIAPDKHEVSQWWLLTESDRTNMCDRTKTKWPYDSHSVYASVRYICTGNDHCGMFKLVHLRHTLWTKCVCVFHYITRLCKSNCLKHYKRKLWFKSDLSHKNENLRLELGFESPILSNLWKIKWEKSNISTWHHFLCAWVQKLYFKVCFFKHRSLYSGQERRSCPCSISPESQCTQTFLPWWLASFMPACL